MADADDSTQKPKKAAPCGIVMPIAGFGEYDAQHWLEVRGILERAISKAEYHPAPVWERSETDIIQGRIVRNLYEYEVVVCDISGLNPNVMFELGLRLAFKKPVVITVDDETKIPFDTNVIEHLIYNRGLHFQKQSLSSTAFQSESQTLFKCQRMARTLLTSMRLARFRRFEITDCP